MSRKTLTLDDRLYEYLLAVGVREDDLLARLRAETAAMPNSSMQIAPEQGAFMALLVGLMDARRIIEVGTFTGYSSICMARALPPGGQLIACDVHEDWTAVARRYWREAGVEDRIQLRLAPAEDTLNALLNEGGEGAYDLIFIDADKSAYNTYYEIGLRLLRRGGMILADNTLWSGRVSDPAVADEDTRHLRSFNEKLHEDPRISLALLPLADGLTLARKR